MNVFKNKTFKYKFILVDEGKKFLGNDSNDYLKPGFHVS